MTPVDDDVIYNELVSDFEFMEFEESTIDNAVDENNYVQSLLRTGTVHPALGSYPTTWIDVSDSALGSYPTAGPANPVRLHDMS